MNVLTCDGVYLHVNDFRRDNNKAANIYIGVMVVMASSQMPLFRYTLASLRLILSFLVYLSTSP